MRSWGLHEHWANSYGITTGVQLTGQQNHTSVLNLCAHSKVKHINVPLKALCEDVTEFENLDIEHINMAHQMADVMMKNLPLKIHWQLVPPMLKVQIPGGAESEGK